MRKNRSMFDTSGSPVDLHKNPAQMRARILLLTPAVAIGGAETYMAALTKHLVSLGHDVHIGLGIDPSLDEYAVQLANVGGQVIRDTLSWNWNTGILENKLKIQFSAAWRIIAQVRPQSLFLNLNWLDAGTGLCGVAGVTNLPTVTLFHLCPHVVPLSQGERRLFRWAHTTNPRWFTVSKDNRLFVARSTGVDQSDIGVIYNGPLIDSTLDMTSSDARKTMRAALRQELRLPTDARIITTVGRHDIQKGMADILPVLPNLLEQYPDLHYLWIGDGPRRELMQRIVRHFDPQGKRITFWPHRQDVQRCLGGSDLFLFPTRFEGFSLALLEAMHAGCCCIVCDVSSVREIIHHNVSGVLIPQGNNFALHGAIASVLNDPRQLARLGRNAQIAAGYFAPDAMLERATAALLADVQRELHPHSLLNDAWEIVLSVMHGRTA